MDSIEDLSRIDLPRMRYYRETYANSSRWDGVSDLSGKHVIVYGEQGLGDIIQFSRYLEPLRSRGCHITLHCPKSLWRLIPNCQFLDKWDNHLPEHDYHVLSMSLPFLLKIPPSVESGYLNPVKKLDLEDENYKIGICWEGNPEHSGNLSRSCRLELFRDIEKIPGVSLYMLNKSINLPWLTLGAHDFKLYGVPVEDLWDTACLIHSLDMIISIDTSLLHLAGAIGHPNVYGLLSHVSDGRWDVSPWYPIKFIRQPKEGDWKSVFEAMTAIVQGKPPVAVKKPNRVLITGGIGDVLALESFYNGDPIDVAYYATPRVKVVRELLDRLLIVKEHIVLWDDFQERDAFIEKGQLTEWLVLNNVPLPDEWDSVEDWSIKFKFFEIDREDWKYRGSRAIDFANYDGELPESFAVIVSASENDDGTRNFTSLDWEFVMSQLEQKNRKGIVLGTGKEWIPDEIIDFRNQTDIFESIGILKKAKAYYGIDSALSVCASKCFDGDDLWIKSDNPHLERFRHIYYRNDL